MLIFALVAAALLAPWRYSSVLLGVATVLKVYPLVTTVMQALRERRMVSLGVAVAAVVGLVHREGYIIRRVLPITALYISVSVVLGLLYMVFMM